MDNARKPYDVLLVEDNPGDVKLLQKALSQAQVRCRLHVVTDGEEALDFLYQRGAHAAAPRPGVVLLDLNLPIVDGREVLEDIKRHPELRRIPVVILTTSQSDEDIITSYDLHANSYVVKPIDQHSFQAVVTAIEQFWLMVASLPAR